MKKQHREATLKLAAIIAAIVFVLGGYAYKASQTQNAAETAKTVAAQAVADPKNNPLVRPHSPVIGRVDAPVTIVEFFDPACESCRAAFPHVHEILKKYPDDVRLVLRYAAFHQGSDTAVGILEAAEKQGMFEQVIAVLLEKQPLWAMHPAPDLDRAWDIAAANGLDVEKAKVDAANPEVAQILQQDAADIKTNNVRGTPTFFVNGKPVSSGVRMLSDMVDQEVTAHKNASANP